jgi:Zn-dependent metalloprotease
MRVGKLTLGALGCALPLMMACETQPETQKVQIEQAHAGGLEAEVAKRLSLEHLGAAKLEGIRSARDVANVRAVQLDALGEAHTRITQTHEGIPVFGGEAIVHLTKDGALKAITNGLVPEVAVDTKAKLTTEEAVDVAVASTGGWELLTNEPESELMVLRHDGRDHLVYRVALEALADVVPTMPIVFVDARSGDVVWQYDNLQTAKSRRVHNLNHGTSLPGPVARTEGQGVVGDTDVDTNYERLGSTYDCYSALFNRDSFDNAGATLISSVHYSNNYVNAFWDGTQMVYGDGDNVYSRSLALSMDVTAHELTHAVTERTSNLIYSGESGGLNEAMSDIFGNVCEWYRDNGGNISGPTSANTWMVGEDIWLADPALRYMNDPALDGASLDYYTSTSGNVDVHYSSGIANLAFYLLSAGGTHPRGRSSTVVTGIGIHDAAQIFYRANTALMTPGTTFAEARVATVTAATDLYGAGSSQVAQVGNAWAAVGVVPPPSYQVIDTRTGLSGAAGSSTNYSYATNGATAMRFVIAGTTGDADLYVRFGSAPTTSAYDCRPYSSSSNETCEFNPAQSGTYYVMIQGYSTYSGLTLTVSAAGTSAPTTETSCTNGTDDDADGATDCADSDCAADPACNVPTTETSCTNGTDDDADGATDCADGDCAADPACNVPATETSCTNGTDDDGDGATDCADSDCAANAACVWTVLSTATFESGWNSYVDGGNDAARFSSSTYATTGTFSIQLRDNSGAASATYSPAYNLSTRTEVRVSWGLHAVGMENGEDYFVELWNGSSWQVVGNYAAGTAFSNNQDYSNTITVPLSSLASRTAVRVRFRCDGSDDTDRIYVDDVVISTR